jgi:hypothetical protein
LTGLKSLYYSTDTRIREYNPERRTDLSQSKISEQKGRAVASPIFDSVRVIEGLLPGRLLAGNLKQYQ